MWLLCLPPLWLTIFYFLFIFYLLATLVDPPLVSVTPLSRRARHRPGHTTRRSRVISAPKQKEPSALVSEVKKNKNEDLKVGFRKALLFPIPTSQLFDEGDNTHPYFLMWGTITYPNVEDNTHPTCGGQYTPHHHFFRANKKTASTLSLSKNTVTGKGARRKTNGRSRPYNSRLMHNFF